MFSILWTVSLGVAGPVDPCVALDDEAALCWEQLAPDADPSDCVALDERWQRECGGPADTAAHRWDDDDDDGWWHDRDDDDDDGGWHDPDDDDDDDDGWWHDRDDDDDDDDGWHDRDDDDGGWHDRDDDDDDDDDDDHH